MSVFDWRYASVIIASSFDIECIAVDVADDVVDDVGRALGQVAVSAPLVLEAGQPQDPLLLPRQGPGQTQLPDVDAGVAGIPVVVTAVVATCRER